ncbi:hypothetical protein GQ457_08G031270 [Hibiscus cannabinus]
MSACYKLLANSYQLNKADTTSASSFQLNSAPFNSTPARLAQLKLNNLEVAESVLCQLEAVLHPRRVSYGMCKAHGSNMCTAHGSCGMCAPCKHMLQIPANFKATIEALLKHSSSFHFENMLTPILDPLRSKEARFTCFPYPLVSEPGLDGEQKAELVKTIHLKAKQRMEKINHSNATRANKGRKQVIFEPGDWV